MQVLDLCGCANFPGLQPFDSTVSSTFPPGTSDNGSTITLTLPPDGILRFSSFRLVNRYLAFTRNALNTSGHNPRRRRLHDAEHGWLLPASRCPARGEATPTAKWPASADSGERWRVPRRRRGTAWHQRYLDWRCGLRTGRRSRRNRQAPAPEAAGTFLGVPELLPLLGGSGGGGGCSTAPSPTSCSGGGGSGGGGANPHRRQRHTDIDNYYIMADGGFGGGAWQRQLFGVRRKRLRRSHPSDCQPLRS